MTARRPCRHLTSADHHGASTTTRQPRPVLFDTDAANLFFQLIASRYEQGSVVVTSNLPFGLDQTTSSGSSDRSWRI